MPTSHLPALGDREFRYLQKMMAEASGIRMSEGKRPLVAGRLMRRLRALGLRDYAQYLDLLRTPEQQVERRLVVDLLTTNETYFFREPQHFRFLAQWLERRRGPLRCWRAPPAPVAKSPTAWPWYWPSTPAPTGRSSPAT